VTSYPPEIAPEVAEQLLPTKLGIEVTQWGPESVTGTMPVEGNLQPYGRLHGGASAALAETLGSLCAAMHAGLERATLGVELSCTHHRGVTEGFVTGVATPIHVGRSVVTVEIVITDEQDRRVCTSRLTCLVRDSRH
jgi:uncharacterized protein (TIGR00369 family)